MKKTHINNLLVLTQLDFKIVCQIKKSGPTWARTKDPLIMSQML